MTNSTLAKVPARWFTTLLVWLAASSFGWASNEATPHQEKINPYTSICQKFEGLAGGYCVHRPSQVRFNTTVLYHLHGLGGSEHLWASTSSYTEQIREEWANTDSPLPIVVSISFGQTWLLAEKNSSPYSGLFEIITQTVIPQIESTLKHRRGKRILLGESMGGFNAIQLALKWNFFDKAAILCAPMSLVSPFSSPAELQKAYESTVAWRYYEGRDPYEVTSAVQQAVTLSKTFFPTEQDWAKANPLQLAQSTKSEPKLYISIGQYDRFASYEANQKFSLDLASKNLEVTWRPLWGGHCAMDIVSLAKFLVR
jgi:predicted esterase